MKKAVSGVMLTLLIVTSMLTLAFNAQPVKAWSGTVYIRANGSIDPPDAPLVTYDNATYTLTDNIIGADYGIVVERDDIVVDGAGYTVNGGLYAAISLVNRSNVTIKNMEIKGSYGPGVYLEGSSNNIINGNNIINNAHGIFIYYSPNNTVSKNNVENSLEGIAVAEYSDNCNISGNNVRNNEVGIASLSSNHIISGNIIENNSFIGICLGFGFNTSVMENNIINSEYGIILRSGSRYRMIRNNVIGNIYGVYLEDSSNNIISENHITNNYFGVNLTNSSDNSIYHNNFINNTIQAYVYTAEGANFWDNGYPSGGNFWSDYTGIDLYSGPYQNETAGDGIGDTPYIIDENNVDHYPLMGSWTTQGSNISVMPLSGLIITFENITSAGITTVSITDVGPNPPSGFNLAGNYYDVKTTANYTGTIRLRINYDDSNMTLKEEMGLRLMQWDEASQQWVDITTSIDTENNVIFGETTHLSLFAIFAPTVPPSLVDETPPTTTFTIGDPKYIDSSGQTYVTCGTPFKLTADDISGSGVFATGYRISNFTYNSGWITSQPPIMFHLTSLADGSYLIEYNSTDYAGNVEPTNTVTVILDTTPPTASLTVGKPKYISDTTYVTSDTPFTLEANDNAGSGVCSIAYRIYNGAYDSGWLPYTAPFYLTSLADGVYTIEFNSTDNLGNMEATKSIQVTLFSWNYIFTDSYGRGTILKINLAHKFFQFITPDKDYGIRNATYMRQCGRAIIIHHYDGELRLITAAVDTKLDFCVAIAWDTQTGKRYFLIDKAGKE